MLGDGFDSGLAAQLFVVLQLEIIVFGVKDDELADSVEIDDGNEIRDQRILGLPYERFAVRRRASPLRPIDQVNEFLMPDLLIRFSQRHRGRREFADLAGAALSVLEIPFARSETRRPNRLHFGSASSILQSQRLSKH